MRKGKRSTKLTDYEKERNKGISKIRYIVEQYFGLSYLPYRAFRARFPRIAKNITDALFRQMAFKSVPWDEDPRDGYKYRKVCPDEEKRRISHRIHLP